MIFTKSITHPNEFSIISGKTQLIDSIESINQSIRLLLTTAKGELFGDPSFGCNLYTYLYDYSGEILYQLIRDDIVKTIREQDSRVIISNSDIEIIEDRTTLQIKLSYKVNNTNYKNETAVFIQKRNEEGY